MINLSSLINTVLLAIGSAVLSGLLGYLIAPWLQQAQKFQRVIRTIWLLPFVLPSFLMGLVLLPAQQSFGIYSNFGIYWVLAAHTLMNTGYIAVMVVANAPAKAAIESAMLAGASPRQIRSYIELPYLLPAVSPALLLVALYSATSFGLVKTLGQGLATLETEIATAALRDLDLNLAIQLALAQSGLTLLLFLAASKIGANRDIEFGFEQAGNLMATRLGKIAGWGYSSLLLSLFLAIISRAFFGAGFLKNLELLTGRGARDILNISLLQAGANSVRNMLLSIAIAFPVVWLIASAKRRRFWPLVPIGISPVVWGLITLILIGFLPRAVSSSWLVLPVIQSFFLLPLLYQLIHPARTGLSTELVAAAKVDGANWWQLTRLIEFPIAWPTIRVALGLACLAALGEFGAASFLTFGDQATLSVALFRLIARPGQENFAMAMTTASLFILLSAYVLWIANRETGRQRQVFQDAF